MEIRHFYQFRFEYILAQFFFGLSIVQSFIVFSPIFFPSFIKFYQIYSWTIFPSSKVPSSILLNFKGGNTLLRKRFLFAGSRYNTFINYFDSNIFLHNFSSSKVSSPILFPSFIKFEHILGQFSIVQSSIIHALKFQRRKYSFSCSLAVI